MELYKKVIARIDSSLCESLDSCPICEHQSRLKNGICTKCSRELLVEKQQEFCRKCGRFIKDDVCDECQVKKWAFNQARAVVPYEDLAKELLYRFKYTGAESLGKVISQLMVAEIIRTWKAGELESIVFVPMTEEKLLARGFNQAQILAEHISLMLGIPVVNRGLIRTRQDLVQAKLSRKKRESNIKGAFVVGESITKLFNKKVLLVDDVLTTATTINECSTKLIEAGVKEVRCIVFAAGWFIRRRNENEFNEL